MEQQLEPQAENKMLSVWTLVGGLFVLLGTIVTGTGVYYLFVPERQNIVMPELHPSLWWGLVMLVFGLILLLAPRLFGKKG